MLSNHAEAIHCSSNLLTKSPLTNAAYKPKWRLLIFTAASTRLSCDITISTFVRCRDRRADQVCSKNKLVWCTYRRNRVRSYNKRFCTKVYKGGNCFGQFHKHFLCIYFFQKFNFNGVFNKQL